MAIFTNKYSRNVPKISVMQNIRKKFPVLGQCIYTNTPATGLLYEDLLEWRRQHDHDCLTGGDIVGQKSFGHMSHIRGTIGKFFGCKSENTALVPNFTLGLNMLLEGLPRERNIMLLHDDYPSLNWPFETRGFACDYITTDGNLEESIHQKINTGKIDVLALSLVQWVNGIKIDLDFLKILKKDHPDLLVIADGTQFCGTQMFCFEESGIDVLGASAYKWLLSGYGNGFVLVNERAKEHFDLKFIGNGSVGGDIAKREDISFCKHLEPGHLDYLNFGSLQFSLNFLESIGLKHIEAQLDKLSHKAKMEFSSLGLLENKVTERNVHSTIFNVSGDIKCYDKLTRAGIVCAPRGNGIRFGFHFYNTENEIDQIVDLLKP